MRRGTGVSFDRGADPGHVSTPPSIESPAADAPPRGAARLLFYIGGAALLLAMAADAIAVIGRHVRIPLLGSIEFVQAAMLVASAAALVFATLAEKHAVVHLLIDRLSAPGKAIMYRVQAAACMIFFMALVVGSAWIAWDLRAGYEESELLHIAYAPLRMVCVLSVLTVAVIYALRLFRRERPR
jgi:TRAP-type transport system small permease protein